MKHDSRVLPIESPKEKAERERMEHNVIVLKRAGQQEAAQATQTDWEGRTGRKLQNV